MPDTARLTVGSSGRSNKEERLLRVESRRLVGRDLGLVPVKTRPDGTRVLLKDVARIDDGFQEDQQQVRLDGKPAVTFSVQRTSSQDTIRVAEKVKAWVKQRQGGLPPNVKFEVWADNWFATYANGELVGEDSVPITTERSFNAETFSFDAGYPLTIAIEAKDFKETDSGIEYIGLDNQQMGDGGFIAQFTDNPSTH